MSDYKARSIAIGSSLTHSAESNEQLTAWRELFYALREIANSMMSRGVKLPMGMRALAFLNAGYLRMRLAFALRDPVLIGVSFCMFASTWVVGGYSAAGAEYAQLGGSG